MDNTLEHFDPATDAFAMIVESLEAAGLPLDPRSQADGDGGDDHSGG